MFALMVESLEGEPVAVRIEDGEGRVMDREIVVERGASSSREILSGLGIRPWRPPVPPVLGKLVEGGAAEQAGLASGDRIVVADGTPVEDWSEWVVFVQDRPEQPIGVVIERDGVRMHLELTPKRVEVGGQAIGRIGAYVQMPDDSFDGYRAELRYPLGEALIQAVAKTWDVSVLTLRMLGYMLVGHASVDNLSGPISIAQYAGKSVSVGFTYFLKFLAVVSISLGVLNLLPIPLLDGGHLFYFVVEALKGSPLSEQAQMLGQRIGLAILLGLMGLAFYLDIGRLLG